MPGLARSAGAAKAAGGKYGLLREHLSGITGPRVGMTFKEVEDLAGRLPESAYRHRAWWGNNDGTAEARAWLDAGWRVESVNQAAGEVVFTRAADGRFRNAPRPAARRPGYVDPQVSASLATRAEAIGLDPGKLTRLAELNENYSRGNAYAAHALLRAILDHIPPLLGCADFTWRTGRGAAGWRPVPSNSLGCQVETRGMRDDEGTFIISGATYLVLEDGTRYATGYWAGEFAPLHGDDGRGPRGRGRGMSVQ